jgi:hypothetical protein
MNPLFRMTAKETVNERRRWNRLPICVPMFVRWTDERKRRPLEFATALNIGGGGALLAMRHGAPVGTTLSIDIPCAVILGEIQLSGSVNQITALVVRVARQDKACLVAASFAAPLEEMRSAAKLSS